jgi:ATPase subunit of ABC transporter with duplicated ATPase domains
MVTPYKDLTEEKKEKLRQNSRNYYKNNKEARKLAHQEWVKQNKIYIRTKQREDKRLRKIRAVEYLGGRCNKCGKDWHPAIYEFHHTDPTTKDRDPSKMLQLSWERLTSELDKCVLLCANCHRLTHHEENYA